jgi:hypothetical protein
LLITSGEECGQKASRWLIEDPVNKDIADEINREHGFVVQFDRCNETDYKSYDVGTDEFRRYVEEKTGFREPDKKSKTDIKVLCRDIPGVNLSIGYRNEHKDNETLKYEHWANTLNMCRKWFTEDNLPAFRRE